MTDVNTIAAAAEPNTLRWRERVRFVEPKVFLVGETRINEEGLRSYLEHVGAPNWKTDAPSDSERLCEVMGRLCYRSFEPGTGLYTTYSGAKRACH